ncbi:calcium-binding protein [Mesorhizobium sp. CN2-181]|uniref:calcium-binding protein n=1 Tax=Mesorhizobium yinganensis TaxID=3157707 RepID=UPI0032B772A3
MPTVTMSFPNSQYLPAFGDYNPSLGELLDLHNATIVGTPNTTSITYKLASGLILKVSGTSFAFDASGYAIAGTATGLQLFLSNGTTVLQALTGFNRPLVNVFDAAETFYYDGGFDAWGFNQWIMSGNDTVNGSAGTDDIYGHAGNDVLKGGNGDDYFEGGSGKDTYDGGTGFDQLSFWDSYWDRTALHGIVLDAVAGTVSDPWGNSETFKGFEGYRGTQFADIINGSSLDEQFYGLGGRDKIDGKGGVDEVRYDRDVRQGGTDGVTVNLTTGVAIDGFGRQDTLISIERVRGTNFDDTLTGNSAANRLRGLDGNDFLDGGVGADDMRGGAGNDTYVVGNVGDTIDENPNSDSANGTDTVRSSITFSLGNTAVVFGNVENLTLTGSLAINGTGNSLANILIGNSGKNTLNGGLGSDTLTGGGGSDFFRFANTLSTSNVDTVKDFSVVNDTIQLENAIFTKLTTTGTLASAAFRANATGAAGDSTDRIIYENDTGKLFYDADGTGSTAAVHFATLTTGLALTNADFSVI